MARDTPSAEQVGGLAIFVQVGRSRSLTDAARALEMSASGVSRAISRLENRLGVQLVNRTTRSLKLTAEGELYLERCRQVLAELTEIEEKLQHADSEPRGRLRVRLPKTFGRAVVVPALAEFSRRYPHIILDVRLASGLADMLDPGIDVAMQLGKPRDARLVAKRLCAINYVLCASPDYLKRYGTPTKTGDLARHRLLAYLQPFADSYREWTLNDGGAVVHYPAQGALNFDDVHALVDAAAGGAGIAYVMDFAIREALDAGRLKIVLPKTAYSGAPAFVIALPDRVRLPRVRAFIDFLFEIVPHRTS